ncbi:MAG: peptidoglycan editing factor PgeF [Erythrobacter sp.]|nr:peptidoglycan editing factor PgeF [Erythrobacter sp.]
MGETIAFDIVRADCLGDLPHGFFGHGGGAHQFGYGGPGDPTSVARLRAAAANAIVAGASLAAPHQVHSPDAIAVDDSWDDLPEGRPVADAVVTDRSGIVLGIVTADCAPVLLADREAGVVGAAHAGWRGAHSGVLANTISAMEKLGAVRSRIAAAIGPAIAQASYEVDEPFRAHFSAAEERRFAGAPDRDGKARWSFDLTGYVADALRASGVAKICDCARDTFSHPERYHSYRRAMMRGEPNYGRQISLIAAG